MKKYYLKVDGKIVGRPKLVWESALWSAEQLSKKLGGVPVVVDTFCKNEYAKTIQHTPGTPYRYRPTNPDFTRGRPFTFSIGGYKIPRQGSRTFDNAKAAALGVLDLFGGDRIEIYENLEFTRICRASYTRAQLLK